MVINPKTKFINDQKSKKASLGYYDYEICSNDNEMKYLSMLENEEVLPANIFFEDKGNLSQDGTRNVDFYEISNYSNGDMAYTEYLLQKIHGWIKFFGIITIIGIVTGVILAVYLSNGLK